jgi:hypothetical protein
MPAQLGYKGFLLRESNQQSASLILGLKTKELQKNLLQTVPENRTSKVLIDKIGKVIEEGRVLPIEKDSGKSITKRAAPHYAGASIIWNHNYARPRNNCYNYANDKVTNTFAQPGRGSGQAPITQATLTNDMVQTYAIRDGLIRMNPHPAPGDAVPGIPGHRSRHLVALVVDPGKYVERIFTAEHEVKACAVRFIPGLHPYLTIVLVDCCRLFLC